MITRGFRRFTRMIIELLDNRSTQPTTEVECVVDIGH